MVYMELYTQCYSLHGEVLVTCVTIVPAIRVSSMFWVASKFPIYEFRSGNKLNAAHIVKPISGICLQFSSFLVS